MKTFLIHVNVLRGVLILLVILYHLNGSWCPHGYLGVDAFFVLSGFFLIQELSGKFEDRGVFSSVWMDYYRRKMLRLVPALCVTVLVSLLVSIPFMLPSDLQMMAYTGRSALAGLSNVFLGERAGDYFSPNLRENIFLHTWYISVLIQLFFVAPILCAILSLVKGKVRCLILAVLILSSASIFYQDWLPPNWKNSLPYFLKDMGSKGPVYYMCAGRVWEVLMGGFIVCLPLPENKWLRTCLLWAGFLILLIPAFCPAGSDAYHLLAVIGTMLIVRYGSVYQENRFFRNPALNWLGTVSFSLYLAHWPIISLAQYINVYEFDMADYLIVACLVIVSTLVLYYTVERRQWKSFKIALVWALSFAVASVTAASDGFSNVLHTQATSSLQHGELGERWHKSALWDQGHRWGGYVFTELENREGQAGKCVRDSSGKLPFRYSLYHLGTEEKEPNFIILGDSFAYTLVPGFDAVGRREGWSGLFAGMYMTPFWGRLNVENGVCNNLFSRKEAEVLERWLKQAPQIRYVIVYQRWHWRFQKAETWDGVLIPEEKVLSFAESSLREFCRKMESYGKIVIFVLPTPELEIVRGADLRNLKQRCHLWYQNEHLLDGISCTRKEYDSKMGAVRTLLEKLESEGLCLLLDPSPYLFKDGVFYALQEDRLTVEDYGHLSSYSSLNVAQGLKDQITRILSSPQQRETRE